MIPRVYFHIWVVFNRVVVQTERLNSHVVWVPKRAFDCVAEGAAETVPSKATLDEHSVAEALCQYVITCHETQAERPLPLLGFGEGNPDSTNPFRAAT